VQMELARRKKKKGAIGKIGNAIGMAGSRIKGLFVSSPSKNDVEDKDELNADGSPKANGAPPQANGSPNKSKGTEGYETADDDNEIATQTTAMYAIEKKKKPKPTIQSQRKKDAEKAAARKKISQNRKIVAKGERKSGEDGDEEYVDSDDEELDDDDRDIAGITLSMAFNMFNMDVVQGADKIGAWFHSAEDHNDVVHGDW